MKVQLKSTAIIKDLTLLELKAYVQSATRKDIFREVSVTLNKRDLCLRIVEVQTLFVAFNENAFVLVEVTDDERDSSGSDTDSSSDASESSDEERENKKKRAKKEQKKREQKKARRKEEKKKQSKVDEERKVQDKGRKVQDKGRKAQKEEKESGSRTMSRELRRISTSSGFGSASHGSRSNRSPSPSSSRFQNLGSPVISKEAYAKIMDSQGPAPDRGFSKILEAQADHLISGGPDADVTSDSKFREGSMIAVSKAKNPGISSSRLSSGYTDREFLSHGLLFYRVLRIKDTDTHFELTLEYLCRTAAEPTDPNNRLLLPKAETSVRLKKRLSSSTRLVRLTTRGEGTWTSYINAAMGIGRPPPGGGGGSGGSGGSSSHSSRDSSGSGRGSDSRSSRGEGSEGGGSTSGNSRNTNFGSNGAAGGSNGRASLRSSTPTSGNLLPPPIPHVHAYDVLRALPFYGPHQPEYARAVDGGNWWCASEDVSKYIPQSALPEVCEQTDFNFYRLNASRPTWRRLLRCRPPSKTPSSLGN